jgi:hypothetical protein
MSIVSGHKLPFGLKNGRMFEVWEVERGLACGCVCPECGQKLQANQGEKRIYFSHDPKSKATDCEGALETAIHKMAKQIISDAKHLKVPELIIEDSITRQNKLYEGSKTVEVEHDTVFTDVHEEEHIQEINRTPDVIAKVNGHRFIIEIAVTHFVDKLKKSKIRQLGLPAIEINLSGLGSLPTKVELVKLVIDEVETKKWISNHKVILAKKELRQYLESLADEDRKRTRKLRLFKPEPYSEIKEETSRVSSNSSHRWIRCEACLNLFHIPISAAPLYKKTVECPDCGFAASGALSSTGKLPVET